jgi:hypothetical protein
MSKRSTEQTVKRAVSLLDLYAVTAASEGTLAPATTGARDAALAALADALAAVRRDGAFAAVTYIGQAIEARLALAEMEAREPAPEPPAINTVGVPRDPWGLS